MLYGIIVIIIETIKERRKKNAFRNFYTLHLRNNNLRHISKRQRRIFQCHKDAEEDEMLRDYSKLLNRLSGLADEMSSYFRRLKQERDKA